jgi:ADP-ribose pyrophosphatase
VGVELVQDLSRLSSPVEGYLRRHRQRVKTRLDDGSRTETYVVDYVDREPHRRDAVAIAIHGAVPARVEDTRILLRRQVRYAAYVVAGRPLTTEVFAGLIEGGERPEEATLREVWEEAGIEIEPGQIHALGPPFFMLPGIFTERVFPVAVQVPDQTLVASLELEPPGDGSPFEMGSDALILTLGEAFERLMRPPPPEDRKSVV